MPFVADNAAFARNNGLPVDEPPPGTHLPRLFHALEVCGKGVAIAASLAGCASALPLSIDGAVQGSRGEVVTGGALLLGGGALALLTCALSRPEHDDHARPRF